MFQNSQGRVILEATEKCEKSDCLKLVNKEYSTS